MLTGDHKPRQKEKKCWSGVMPQAHLIRAAEVAISTPEYVSIRVLQLGTVRHRGVCSRASLILLSVELQTWLMLPHASGDLSLTSGSPASPLLRASAGKLTWLCMLLLPQQLIPKAVPCSSKGSSNTLNPLNKTSEHTYRCYSDTEQWYYFTLQTVALQVYETCYLKAKAKS